MISDLKVNRNKICFKTDAGPGNALIAALDDSGIVIWNWHIWMTDYNPSEDMDTRMMNGVSWMDRNLGAGTNSYDAEGM